jgi:hypothetical protein
MLFVLEVCSVSASITTPDAAHILHELVLAVSKQF